MIRRRWAGAASVAAVAAAVGAIALAGQAVDSSMNHPTGPPGRDAALHWQASWRAAPQPPVSGPSQDGFAKQTVRMIVHPTATGRAVRIRISNAYGGQPLQVGVATVAEQRRGPVVDARTVHTVTFAGHGSMSVPVGAEVVSDPVPMDVSPRHNLAVSLYLPGPTGPATWHKIAQTTNYLAAGNWTTEPGGSPYQDITPSWYFVDGVDVLSHRLAGTVVAFGDSITDGAYSTLDDYATYPDQLARRAPDYAVLNQGIGGNEITTDSAAGGQSALNRFERDAIDQPGVTTVLFLEGVNDIGRDHASASRLIAAMQQLIDAAHAQCVRILGGTITPFKHSVYDSDAHEQTRKEVNEWIRTSGAFDGVVDFDKVIRDPSDLLVIAPRYHTVGDLHPNDAGYHAMADGIDLSLLHNGRTCANG
jgi:lysophospholipase L1-like esterase